MMNAMDQERARRRVAALRRSLDDLAQRAGSEAVPEQLDAMKTMTTRLRARAERDRLREMADEIEVEEWKQHQLDLHDRYMREVVGPMVAGRSVKSVGASGWHEPNVENLRAKVMVCDD